MPVTGKLLETLVIQLLDRGRGRRTEWEKESCISKGVTAASGEL